MIIHDSHRRPRRVRVVNSRLPVYEIYHGDGFGNVVRSLVTRIAPKTGPLAKQFAMKAVDVVKDKALGTAGNLAGKTFEAIKNQILRLIRKPRRLNPVKLPSTEIMPPSVSKEINKAANQKLAEIALSSPAIIKNDIVSKAMQDNITANLIAGSGFW